MRISGPVLLLLIVVVITACGSGCLDSAPAATPTPAPTTPENAGTPFSFVVFGDTRDLNENTTTGISPQLRPIATAIAAEHPAFAIFTGDLINGWMVTNTSPISRNYTAQFRNWMAAVSPIHEYTTGAGVPIYVVRGNHDDGVGATIPPLLNAYLETVAREMPANGPANETRLTYSFTYGGIRFIGLDQYTAHNRSKETVAQAWLETELARGGTAGTFVFGHAPAYLVMTEREEPGFGPYDLSVHPAERDRFWSSLVSHRVPIYFCGHTHQYVRGEAMGVQQVICGNGGAPGGLFDPAGADPALRVIYPAQRTEATGQTVGYLLVTVDLVNRTASGVQKLMHTETGRWETGDRFTLPLCRPDP